MTTTVTGLYDSYAAAKPAVDALERAGISSSDISVIAHNGDGSIVDKNHTNAGPDAGGGAGIGAVVGGAGGLLAGLGMIAIPGIGPVVAAGWLIATAVGAVGGAAVGAAAGGIIGSLTNAGVDEREANLYAEGVRRGGTLVAARVDDDEVLKAQEVLGRYQPVDPVAREAAYRQGGWRAFDETAPLYTAEEIEAERQRYR
jgi:heat induced stress protein YflT